MMEKKIENGPPPPPSSVGDYDDNQSTFTVDQPPPAYRKPDLPAVKMTKIVAATILIVTFIAGVTAIAIVYMQHNLKCSHLAAIQESSSAADSEMPQAAKVVQREEDPTASSGSTPVSDDKSSMFPDLLPPEAQDQLKKLSFPIHIDMDDITGRMMEKNQRARLNCVIEKKRSEEIIPRAPKTLQTPFGNLTTDPKFTHITGETMSLTCRSGNERVSRPVAEKAAAPSPILIQIPIQRAVPAAAPAAPQPSPPAKPSVNPALRPLNIHPQLPQQQLPLLLQQLQQQQGQQLPLPQQQAPSHQVNIQGPIPLHPQGLPPPQEQHHRMMNPFQQLRLPFMPLPQFPQIPLRDVIPHLLDIHKQIQQQRQEEEQQQRRQREQQRNKNMQQRPKERGGDDDSDEDDLEDRLMHGSQESQGQGRALPMHDMPMQQQIIPGPHPFMQQPHPNQPPQQHLRPDGMHPHQKQTEQQQQQQQHQQQRNSQEEEHEHHPGGPNGHLDGAPSFHDMPHVVPPTDMMMDRAGPLPFIIGSHNMQPRSSARPRMKRMAGACSCVCK